MSKVSKTPKEPKKGRKTKKFTPLVNVSEIIGEYSTPNYNFFSEVILVLSTQISQDEIPDLINRFKNKTANYSSMNPTYFGYALYLIYKYEKDNKIFYYQEEREGGPKKFNPLDPEILKSIINENSIDQILVPLLKNTNQKESEKKLLIRRKIEIVRYLDKVNDLMMRKVE